jgi:hypothetical protein
MKAHRALHTTVFISTMPAIMHDEAIAAFRRSQAMSFTVRACLAARYAQVRELDCARVYAAETLQLKPDFSVAAFPSKHPFQRDPKIWRTWSAVSPQGRAAGVVCCRAKKQSLRAMLQLMLGLPLLL